MHEEKIATIVSNEADMAYRRRVQTIFEWLAPTDTDVILDAGCGRGFYLRFLRHLYDCTLAGIELEYDVVAIAREALATERRITLSNASLYALPFATNTFDKAIISEVLEHVPDDVAALKGLKRVVKPGGLIAITVPNANYPFWWDPINKTLETVFKTHIQHGVLAGIWANHVRLYTRQQLRDAVHQAGLEVADERAFTHYAFPFIHNIVYGFGKTALEAGVLPKDVAAAADRFNTDGHRGSALNPVNIGLSLFEWFDRRNVMDEPEGRSTVNVCILARVPSEE